MIRLAGICKRFPGVQALDQITLEIPTATCHALVGENGAGKSTLGALLAGIHRPDAGQIYLAGRAVRFATPRDAARAGVGMVHQELVFCPNLSIAENLCLSDLPRRGFLVNRQELARRATDRLRLIGLDLDVWRPVGSLSLAQEQLVQIAAAVGRGARLLIFDEPTSTLGAAETERLLALIKTLPRAGVTVLYVSHRLEEIYAICGRATVLRDGRLVATVELSETPRAELVRLMVGRTIAVGRRSAEGGAVCSEKTQKEGQQAEFAQTSAVPQASSLKPQASHASAQPLLAVRNFSSPGRFSDISLEVAAGEIVGLAGLVGAGRSEILAALFGLDRQARGEIRLDGRLVRITSPRSGMRQGLALAPEDRKRQGLVLSLSLAHNLSLALVSRFRRWAAIDRGKEGTFVAAQVARFGIRAAHAHVPTVTLSGGNQQKVVLSRATSGGARVLLIDEPTRGVDVGAKDEIHRWLRTLAEAGNAILLVSSELEELLALANRLIVLREGRIAATFTAEEATPERVGQAMTGSK